MLTWIEKTRRKPKAVRNRYAFVGASTITAVIVLFWIVSLPAKLDQIAAENNAEHESTEVTQSVLGRFFDSTKQNIATIFGATDAVVSEEVTIEAQSEPEKQRGVEVPTLDTENIQNVLSRQRELNRVPPRVVLIGTTSASSVFEVTRPE